MKSTSLRLLAATTLALTSLSGLSAIAASPSLVLTLNGKAVNSVPIDKLSDLLVTLSTGGPSFKQIYSGQWSGINQSLNMTVRAVPKGTPEPDPGAGQYAGYDLEITSRDSNWGGKNSTSASMLNIAVTGYSGFSSAIQGDSLMLNGSFYRRVYTGKQVWQDGGWVQESRWENVGPTLGKALLKLEPPTFAASFDTAKLFPAAVAQFNQKDPDQDRSHAQMHASFILKESYDSRTKLIYEGSKINSLTPVAGEAVKFKWSRTEARAMQIIIHADQKIQMNIHAAVKGVNEDLPLPMNAEADFICPAEVRFTRPIQGGEWKAEFIRADDEREACRTADGKTPEQVNQALNPMGAVSNPADLLKKFGF